MVVVRAIVLESLDFGEREEAGLAKRRSHEYNE